MPPTRRRVLALACLALALAALTGCDGGNTQNPTPVTSAPVAPTTDATPSATVDTWAGYFDAERAKAAVGQYVWQSWGTFGDPGAVAPFRAENRTLDAGRRTVVIHCAGPETVTAHLSTAAGDSLGAPVALACPAATPVPIDLPDRGLVVQLDSHGIPGALLIQVTDGS